LYVLWVRLIGRKEAINKLMKRKTIINKKEFFEEKGKYYG
jgi:hypothetical protein